MSDALKKKAKFRATSKWKNFRKYLRNKQKIDPVTGSKLNKVSTCHHLSLDVEQYTLIGEDRQVMLNCDTHTCLHFLYGNERIRHDWRKRLDNLAKLCEIMDKFNGEFKDDEE